MSMKIVAGLGSVDEYIRYCEAGADEFFCGYVPYKWTKKYGNHDGTESSGSTLL